jgi:hypothetical protein
VIRDGVLALLSFLRGGVPSRDRLGVQLSQFFSLLGYQIRLLCVILVLLGRLGLFLNASLEVFGLGEISL